MYGLGNLGNKVTAFTVRAVNATKYLQDKKCPADILSQFRRSSTSIGANCSEAQCAQTKADYYTKLHIALKEANETVHWIDVLHEYHLFPDDAYISLRNDCVEICKILTAILKKIRQTIENENKK